MATSITTIKSKARETLKGNWPIAIVSALTIVFSLLIIQNVAWVLSIAVGDVIANFVMLLLSVLFVSPLMLGVLRHFWRIQGGLEETPATAFYYFSNWSLYHKAIRLSFMLALRLLFLVMIYFLPAIIAFVVSWSGIYEFLKIPIPIWTQHLSHTVKMLSVIGTVLTGLSLIKFYLAPVLVVINESIDAEEAIHMSMVISKESFADFVFLFFSLLFWIAISILFIPLIFTLPYFIMCYITHSMEAIKAYNNRIQRLDDEFFPSFIAGA